MSIWNIEPTVKYILRVEASKSGVVRDITKRIPLTFYQNFKCFYEYVNNKTVHSKFDIDSLIFSKTFFAPESQVINIGYYLRNLLNLKNIKDKKIIKILIFHKNYVK